MKRLRVCDRVMTSHGACTNGISRVFTVASVQRLEMEALIPAPADCEVRSVIKFLNAQSIAAIEIRQLSLSMATHGSTVNTSPAGVRLGGCLIIIHPIARTSRPVTSIFSYTSRNFCAVSVFRLTERRKRVSQWLQSQAARLLRHRIQTLVPRYDKYLNFGGEYVEK